MEAIAHAKFVRIAPRKTRLLVALVRGMTVANARRQLAASQKLAANAVKKTLESAVANAKHRTSVSEHDLVVTQAFVNEGPAFVRYTPKAHGRATPVRHRLSHITIAVGTES